jgi:hypothetical protein
MILLAALLAGAPHESKTVNTARLTKVNFREKQKKVTDFSFFTSK